MLCGCLVDCCLCSGGGGGGGDGGDGGEVDVRGVDVSTGLGFGRVTCAPTALEGALFDADVEVSGGCTFLRGW